MAELEELLLKVDSELGNMGGIDSAIQVLQTLKDISEKATNGADSLVKLAGAFQTLNKEGKNTQGIQNLKSQIGTLTGVLDQLADHTKSADKTIKQLGDLGEALKKFAGLSESLKGLSGITGGINDMVNVLDALGGLQSASQKASSSLKTVASLQKDAQKANKSLNYIQNLKNIKNKSKNGLNSLASSVEIDNERLKNAYSNRAKELEYAEKNISDLSKNLTESFGIKSKKGINETSKALKSLYDAYKNVNKNPNDSKLLGSAVEAESNLNEVIKTFFSLRNEVDETTKSINDYVKATNKTGTKINVSEMAQEYGEDYKRMRAVLGKAFTKDKKGIDFESYIHEMKSVLGENIFSSSKPTEVFAELVKYIQDAKESTLDFNEAIKKGVINEEDVGKAFLETHKELFKIAEAQNKISEGNYQNKAPKIQNVKFNKSNTEKKSMDDVASGINNLASSFEKLDAIDKGVENLSKLGEALHSFNGLDDNLKSLNSMAMGIRNLIKSVEEADKIDEHSFDFIKHIKTALDTLANNSAGYGNIGSATSGLAKLLDALDSTKTIDLSKLDALKEKMLSLNTDDFKGTAHQLSVVIKELNTAFESLHKSAGSITQTMGVIDYGFDEATSGLYNVREQIEIITEDFDRVLSPVLNSRLIEILETFRSMNDSYKNVSGIAQGLGVLLDVLTRMQIAGIKQVDADPVEGLLRSLNEMAESGIVEKVSDEFEKFGGVTDSIARLFNALKYFAEPLDPNKSLFAYLKKEIEAFNKDIKGNFDDTRNLLYGFKHAFEALQKDSSVVKDDNLFEWLKEEIKEFDKLVGGGGNIKVIGNLLRGIADVAKIMEEGKGLNQKSTLFDNLKSKLTDLYNWSTQNSEIVSNFSKIANLLRSIVDVANVMNQGVTLNPNDNVITNLATALKNFDPSVLANLEQLVPAFKGISDLMKAIGKLTFRNETTVGVWMKTLAEGLTEINVATSDMAGAEKAINSVNRLMNTVDSADKNMSVDDNPLKIIGLGLEKVSDELKKLDGAEKAVNSVSNLISTVSSTEISDNNSLTKIATSVKAISEVKDAKEIGSLASNLSKLVEIVGNIKIDGRKNNAIDNIYNSIKKFDNLKSDKGQLTSLAKDFGKLINVVAENEDKIGTDNVLTRIVNSLNGFKDIAENTKGLKGTLGAIGSLVKIASEKVDFGKDNPLSQLKRILGGFANITEGTKGLDKVVKSLLQAIEVMKLVNGTQGFTIDKDNNPFAILKTQLEAFKDVAPDLENLPKVLKAFKDFVKEFDISKGIKIDAQPIEDIVKAVSLAQGKEDAITNFKAIISSVGKVTNKGDASKLTDIATALGLMAENLTPFATAGKLQSLIDIANAMVKMKDIEPDKFKAMAEAIRDIMSALGSINGNNNTIKITLDERGIVNAEHDIQSLHKTWEEYVADVAEDVQAIDFSGMFDIEGSTKHLQEELKKAQSSLDHALKEKQRWQNSMEQTERVKGEAGAQEADAYRRAYANYEKASKEASEYERIVASLTDALREKNGYELDSDAEGYRLRKNLTEEKKRLEEMLKSMRENQPQLEIFGDREEQNHVLDMVQERLEQIDNVIIQINNELENGVSSSVEGLQEQVRIVNQEWDEQLSKVRELNGEIGKTLGDSTKQIGDAFKNVPILNNSDVFKNIGSMISDLGSKISRGKINLPFTQKQLQGILSFAGILEKVIGSIGVFATFVSALYKDIQKVTGAIVEFSKKVASFSKTMLSKVVGAFNAVAGVVSRVASLVRSGAEGISVALRKIGDVGNHIVSIFGKIGHVLSPALKGLKAIGTLITPRIIRTLASADFSLGQIIKKSRVITKLMKTATRWFTTMTRMLMRRTITAFFNEIKQAFQDLAVFEKHANDELLNFNTNVSKIFSALRIGANQWMGAFEPLINALTPTILNFLNNVQAMGENVAKFMAILTGQPYYIRAKQFYEDYAENVEDTTKKVKNLTNGLDELNILSANKDDKSGILPEDMFEKVPIDGSFEGIKIAVDGIIDSIVDFLQNIDWAEIKDKVRDFIHKLMTIINDILARLDLWEWLGKTIAELFNTLMTAWNQFIIDFDPVATEKAIATLIINALNSIDWDLIHENIELTAKKFAQFWNEVFSDDELWKSITNTIINGLNEIVHYFDTFAWNFNFTGFAERLAQTIKDVLEGFDWTQLTHAVEGWAQGLVDIFNTLARDSKLWKDIGETLRNAINEIIHAFDKLGDVDFASAVKNLKLAIETMLDIDWDSFKEGVEKWTKDIADVINGFFADEAFLSKITTSIGKLADTILNALDSLLEQIRAYDIGTAITNSIEEGLKQIDWDNVFTLPADAINKLSEAIRGLLDSLPEDFNLGTWLTEHFELTFDAIDWDLIERNVEDLRKQISDFIAGVLQNEEFWQKAGDFTGRVIKIGLDLVFEFFNFNGEDLGNAIKEYINSLISKVNIGEYISKAVDVFIDLVVALDVVLTGVDWEAIGDQIAQGIVDAINKLFENRNLIRKTIEDAFKVISTLLSKVLTAMLRNSSFYKLGQLLGEIILGFINGLASLLTENGNKLRNAMKQFAKGLGDFIKQNQGLIVEGLNTIIHEICEIIKAFFDAKSDLFDPILDVIAQLNLGEILGTLLYVIIRKAIAKIKLTGAMLAGILRSLGDAVNGIMDALKPYLMQVIVGAIVSAIAKWALGKAGEFAGGAVGGLIGSAFGPVGTAIGTAIGRGLGKKIFGAIGAVLGAIGGAGLGDAIAGWFKGKDGESIIDKAKNAWEGFKSKLPWNKDKEKATIEVEPEIDIDDTATNWDDLFDDTKKVPIELEDPKLGTITASEIIVEVLSPTKINTEEINADFLYLGEIFADVLHVAEIDSNMEGAKSASMDMDKLFAGNEGNVIGGKLTNPNQEVILNGDDFLEKLAKLETDILLQLEKLLGEVLGKLREIFSLGTGVDEFTTPNKTLGQVTLNPNIDDIYATTLHVEDILANTLTLSDIVADKLTVGNIEGNITGSTTNVGGNKYYGDLDLFGGYGNLTKPEFEVGDRWSDISGVIESAEDYLADIPSEIFDTASLTDAIDSARIDSTKPSENTKTDSSRVSDYLMDAIGNENGVFGVLGNIFADKGLDVTKDTLNMSESELSKLVGDLKANTSLWNQLQNATSIHEASNAVLKGYENEQVYGNGTNEESIRWFNGEKLARNMKDRNDGEVENVDEFTIVDNTENNSSNGKFLGGLVLSTEYTMAEVYNVIDKWLGRIWRLLDSFVAPNILENIKAELENFNVEGTVQLEIFDDIKEQLERISEDLEKLLKDGIKCQCTCDCTGDTTHLDNNTKAKSANTKAVEDNTKAIMDMVHNGLGNVTCNCNCGGNCGDCAMGQQEHSVHMPENYAPLDYVVDSATDTIDDVADNIANTIDDALDDALTHVQNGIDDIVKDIPQTTPTSTPTNTTVNTPSRNVIPNGSSTRNYPSTPYVPSTTRSGSGSTSGGNDIVWKNANGTNAPLFANIGGQMVRLSDNLSNAMKNLVKSGAFSITDSKGNALNSKDYSSMIKFLKNRWKDSDDEQADLWEKYILEGKDGNSKQLYAMIDGVKVALSDYLDEDTKLRILNGIWHGVDIIGEDGVPITDDEELDKIRDSMIAHGWGTGSKSLPKNYADNTSKANSDTLSYKDADMLSLIDNGKERQLYATLEGERFSVGKDMPKDIRERLMNGEGTLDLDGTPLSAFKGKRSSSGFDVGDDNSWREMMRNLWGGNKSEDETSNTTSVTTPSNYADAIADAQSGWAQNDGGGKPAPITKPTDTSTNEEKSTEEKPVEEKPVEPTEEKPTEEKPTEEDEDKLKGMRIPDARTGDIKDGYGNVVGHVDGYWKDAEGNGSYWRDGNKVSYEDYLKNPKNNPSSNIAKASGKTFSDDFVSNYAWATPDVVTGMTDYYDADGNKIASVATKDIVAKQNEKKAEAIKKAEEERVANEKAKNEEARKKKNESTPIIYQGTDNLIGGVLTDEVKAQREAYTKTVEEYRKKAKEFMDIINKNGTDTQKASAENYFNSLNTNKASRDASPYKFNYDKLEDMANQVKVANAFGEDYKNIRVQTNGGIFAIKDLLKTESGQLVLADVLDKYEKGKEVRFYKQGNGSSNSANKSDRITDEETVKDLISKLKSLGIDAKSAKEETSTESTTPEEGTDTASQIDKFVNLFKKQAKIMKNPVSDEAIKLFNSAGIQAGAKILFADGKRLTSVTPWQKANSYASYAREKRILEDEVANNVDVKGFYFNNAESSNPKSDFEKWYKDSFLVRGYQMGGLPNSGELFISRENGTPEFVGSFGNKTAVANNDQIVTAVANGVSMANDRVVNAIQSQTNSLEDAIDKKDLDVQIGDRQIAEANRRGEKGLGGSFIK